MKALLAATPRAQLVDPSKPKKIKGLTGEQMMRMEGEMGSVQDQYRMIEESLGPNVLTLMVTKSYLCTLLNNARIVKYIGQYHPDYLTEFQKITEMTSLGSDAAL